MPRNSPLQGMNLVFQEGKLPPTLLLDRGGLGDERSGTLKEYKSTGSGTARRVRFLAFEVSYKAFWLVNRLPLAPFGRGCEASCPTNQPPSQRRYEACNFHFRQERIIVSNFKALAARLPK